LNAYTKYRLNIIFKLGLAGILLSIVSRLIDGSPLLVPGTVVAGISLGVLVGIFELFFFKSKLRNFSFLTHLLLKAVILCLVIYALITLLLFVDYLAGEFASFEAYLEKIFNPEMYLATFVTFLSISVLLFFLRLDHMLGPGNLAAYIKGTFHKPREEQRIFMFLDLKDSTRLAEQMSKNDYFSFLNDYFYFMTEPILETGAQIYQYVGDEIVLTWDFKKGIKNNNCIEVFFKIKEVMDQQNSYFHQKYGIFPEFKAGLHYGIAIQAQIGDLKKEIVFNGDVLNTTARIQSICNELGHELLISAELFNHLQLEPNQSTNLGLISLKGKENEMQIYSIKPPN
jgi:adenylate cyclase